MEEQKAEVQNQTPEAKKRPTFLTVLCILSFIGVAFAVISGFIDIATSPLTDALMENSEEVTEAISSEIDEALQSTPEMKEALSEADDITGISSMVSNSLKHRRTLGVINVIAALIVLFGVIRMWSLKKSGYYIYIIGEIAPVIASILLIGTAGLFGGSMAIVMAFFPILFIILYGLNVKHMS